MMRVVVTGSECTGKTTLAAALARHFDTVWVPEFARRFVERAGRPPRYADVDAIARGQIAWEDAIAGRSGGLFVLDTDLLSTLVYSPHYFGDCPAWIEDAWRRRAGDLYLLAGIDVPWLAEAGFRDRGDRRAEMHELFRTALKARAVEFRDVTGLHEARLEAAVRAVEQLIGKAQRGQTRG